MAPTRDEIRQATHARVLAAADRLFGERGFAATTVRDVADASGVSVGTVMAAGDKSALLVQVVETAVEAEHDRWIKVGTSTGDACADRVADRVRPFVVLFASRPELARAYAAVVVAGSRPSTLFDRLADVLAVEIRAVITSHGCTPADSVDATADALHSSYVGTLLTAAGRDDVDALDARLRATLAAITWCDG